jgi:hypothetical protein
MPEVNRSAFAGAGAAAARGGGGSRKSPLRLATDPVPVVSTGSSRALIPSRTAASDALIARLRSSGSSAGTVTIMPAETGTAHGGTG